MKHNWFYRRFLDNHFVVIMFDILLVLLAILVFTKIAWVFQPVAAFLGIVAPPFIFAGILYYLLVPIVNWLTRRKVPRVAAIAALFLTLLGLIVLGIARFVPAVERQFTSIISNWPSIWTDFTAWLTRLNESQNLISQKELNQLGTELVDLVAGKKGTLLTGTVAQLQNLVGIVGNVVVTVATAPIILFFMLKDGAHFPPLLLKLLPVRMRPSVKEMLSEMNEKVGSYVQGQITVAIAVGIMFMIGYSIIGLKYALIFGLIATPLNLIPYFGSALAMVPSLITGAIAGPKMFIGVIVVFFIEWLLETQVISPLVMGSKLELHPITIVVVLLTAGNLFGLVGVILGIPGFAVLKIIATRLFSWYRQVSGLYDDPKEQNS